MVACDGLVFALSFPKVRKLSDGRIFGLCGTAYDFEPFGEWLEKGGDCPKLSEEFEGLVLSPDGTCRSYAPDGRSILEEIPTATGGGKQIALGAMHAGASAEEALRICCERSLGTGGTVTVLTRPRRLRRVA